MRFYEQHHKYYCGVDLHARSMYLGIQDDRGPVLFHKNLPTDGDAFKSAVADYRENLVVAVECMFSWYWLADLCTQMNIRSKIVLITLPLIITPLLLTVVIATLSARNGITLIATDFLHLVRSSGRSSWELLQNISVPSEPKNQELALALSLTSRYIRKTGEGACRVHGGGFAGTILVFLPDSSVPDYVTAIEEVYGLGAVNTLGFRSAGAMMMV